ncbi:5-methylcytosine-specific restriction endonuclease McrA [Methanofollis sp. W23]|uniref:HNH endonuclease n=1 Tax=Methanofollis sp. W23 TaxID=2817849 RepID=UPI001AE4313E|nr:HNH endonuclease [Methanofollis sp. W23]MBP2147259.1 5-methylcytosine-specific restriction endonuclease McrA [Methanofollis sp. W23]
MNSLQNFLNRHHDDIVASVAALERDGHKCNRCGATDALEVHHIVPVHAGGTNTKENLTTLCHKCHVMIHAEERESLRREKERTAMQTVLNQHGGKSIEDWG